MNRNECFFVLGIAPTNKADVILQAYNRQMKHWNGIASSNPERRAEALAMIDKVDEAYEQVMPSDQGEQGGLEYHDGPAIGGTASQVGSQPVDINACPYCGFRDNPSDARYCINCQRQIFQLCPSCGAELPWHQKVCHRCGVNIQEELDHRAAEERRLREAQVEAERRRVQEEAEQAIAQQQQKRKNRIGCTTVIVLSLLVAAFFAVAPIIRLNQAMERLNGDSIAVNKRTLPSDGSVYSAAIVIPTWGLEPAGGSEPSEPDYYADIKRVYFGKTEFKVEFEAVGESDQLAPQQSCLAVSDGSWGGIRVQPTSMELTVDTPAHYVGLLGFPLDLIRSDDSHDFYFLYGCMYDSVELFSRNDLVN